MATAARIQTCAVTIARMPKDRNAPNKYLCYSPVPAVGVAVGESPACCPGVARLAAGDEAAIVIAASSTRVGEL